MPKIFVTYERCLSYFVGQFAKAGWLYWTFESLYKKINNLCFSVIVPFPTSLVLMPKDARWLTTKNTIPHCFISPETTIAVSCGPREEALTTPAAS
jgi:hypothetical protein